LATALLGTEQRKCTVVSPEIEFLSSLDSVDPQNDHEAWFLLASAYVSTYRRAGQTLAEIQPAQILPAAPAESKQLCSTPVAARLANLLVEATTMEPFLEEALTLLAHKERLVHPGLLPDLFNWAKRSKQRRGLLVPVVGERGQWLAMHNPEWKNVLQVDGEEAVRHAGNVSGQQALLAALNIDDNFFSRTFSVIKGRALGGNARLIQLVMDKLLAESKPGRAHYPEQQLVRIAAVVPPVILRELTSRIYSALAKEQTTWLPRLADLLDYRRQMLEEMAHE
jgi:hypothetical protein